MLIDFILPDSLDPTVKLIVNVLVGVHLAAFFCYVILLARSFGKKPQDWIRQFASMNSSQGPETKKDW